MLVSSRHSTAELGLGVCTMRPNNAEVILSDSHILHFLSMSSLSGGVMRELDSFKLSLGCAFICNLLIILFEHEWKQVLGNIGY